MASERADVQSNNHSSLEWSSTDLGMIPGLTKGSPKNVQGAKEIKLELASRNDDLFFHIKIGPMSTRDLSPGIQH